MTNRQKWIKNRANELLAAGHGIAYSHDRAETEYVVRFCRLFLIVDNRG